MVIQLHERDDACYFGRELVALCKGGGAWGDWKCDVIF